MVSALALSLALSKARTLTVWIPAAPLDQIIRQLGEQTAQKLACDGALRDKIVVAKFEGADPQIALRRLADLTDAEWVDRDGFKTLVPDKEKLAASSRANLQRREKEATSFFKQIDDLNSAEYGVSQVVTALQNEKRRIESPSSDFTFFRSMSSNPWSLPVGRLSAKVVASIPREAYLSIRPGERVVFSSRPNRRQQRLPVDVALLDRQWRSDGQIAQQALSEIEKLGNKPGREFPGMKPPENANIHRILFSVSHMNEFFVSLLMGSLVVLDSQDQILATNSFTIWTGSAGEVLMGLASRPSLTDDVELSELAMSQARAATVLMNMNEGQTAPADAAIVADVDKHEPLSLVPSELLRDYLSKKTKNFLLELPDEMIVLAVLIDAKGKTNAKMVERLVDGFIPIKLENSEDWYVARPEEPELVTAGRVPRGAIADMARLLARGASVTLDQYADYVSKRPPGFGTSLLELITFSCVVGGREANVMMSAFGDPGQSSDSLIRVYGKLSRVERDMFIRSGAYAVGKAPMAIKSDLEDSLFRGTESWMSMGQVAEPESMEEDGLGAEVTGAAPQRRLPNFFEATEFFVDGLPTKSVIRVETVRQATYYELGPDPQSPWVEVALDELAVRLAAVREPALAKSVVREDPIKALPAKIRVAGRTTYTFSLNFDPPAQQRRKQFVESIPPASGSEVQFSNLPRPVLSEIEEKSAQVIRGWKEVDPPSGVTKRE